MTLTPSRIARANAAYDRQVKANSAAAAAASLRYTQEHDRSERAAERERMAIVRPWPGLLASIGWFKREWQDALPRHLHDAWDTVEPGDSLGSPRLNDRWRAYLFGGTDTHEPIRHALRGMALSSDRSDRVGAAYLFTLACMDFQPALAGWALAGHCACYIERDDLGKPTEAHPEHPTVCTDRLLPLPDEYVLDYAQRMIDRLRALVVRAERQLPRSLPEPEWKARLGIGVSESQHRAQEAAHAP